MPVLVDGERARWPDRSVGNVHAREARLVARLAGRRINRLGPQHAVDRRPLQQPARLFLSRVDRVDAVPGDMTGCDRGGSIDGCLVIAEDRDEIAVAQYVYRALGGATDRRLVDR